MVEFFFRGIFDSAGIPAVLREFADDVMTGFMKEDFILCEHITDMADTGNDIVLSSDDFEFLVGTDTGDEAGGGRVNNNGINRELSCEEFKSSIMFFVSALDAFAAGIVVIFFQPVPDAVPFCPEADRSGVNRAVIAGDDISGEMGGHILLRDDMAVFVEHGIDNTFGNSPFAEDESVIEDTGIHTAVAFLNGFGKRGVIIHSEMEIEGVFLFFFENPFLIEPVIRIFGITVKPEFRIRDGASGRSLFDKGTGHENDFIKENAAEGHTLNHRCRAFILTAEQIESVCFADSGNIEIVFALELLDMKAGILKDIIKRPDEVTFDRSDSFSADSEGSIPEVSHRPADKSEGHREGFAASDRAVTDNSIMMMIIGESPPLEGEALFWRKGIKNHPHHLPEWNQQLL